MPEKLEGDRLPTHLSLETLCHHCEGKGYIELRDCSGEIQRDENCSFCGGTGKSESKKEQEVNQEISSI